MLLSVDSKAGSVQVDAIQRSFPSAQTGEFLTSGMQAFSYFVGSHLLIYLYHVPTLPELLQLQHIDFTNTYMQLKA